MDDEMLPEYDFSNARPNPYIKDKKNITIRLEARAINYFKELSTETGLPYQTLINMFLMQCAATKMRPNLAWESTRQ